MGKRYELMNSISGIRRRIIIAKVNALRERTPTVPAGGTPSSVLREGRRGFDAVRAGQSVPGRVVITMSLRAHREYPASSKPIEAFPTAREGSPRERGRGLSG